MNKNYVEETKRKSRQLSPVTTHYFAQRTSTQFSKCF